MRKQLLLLLSVLLASLTASAQAADAQAQPVYNLTGQRVGQEAKGIVVKDGRKVLRK